MQSLCDELLLHIFQFVQDPKTVLNHLPFVCKRWKHLCINYFTGKLDLSFADEDWELEIDDETVLKLRKRFKYINILVLRDHTLKEETVVELCMCKKLIKVVLSHNSDIKKETITKILKLNTNIKKLDLSVCTKLDNDFLFFPTKITELIMIHSNISNITILKIATFCPDLEVLNISFANSVSGPAMILLLKKCKKLKTLSVTGCSNIEDIWEYCGNLEKLYCLGTKIRPKK